MDLLLICYHHNTMLTHLWDVKWPMATFNSVFSLQAIVAQSACKHPWMGRIVPINMQIIFLVS